MLSTFRNRGLKIQPNFGCHVTGVFRALGAVNSFVDHLTVVLVSSRRAYFSAISRGIKALTEICASGFLPLRPADCRILQGGSFPLVGYFISGLVLAP